MKLRHILTACALAASCAASAADVSLSGNIDTYVEAYSVNGQTFGRLSSGGISPSFLTIRAEEELGSGTKAFAKLEMGFLPDTGEFVENSSLMFQREALVGISGDFGRLSFGKQYTPHFLTFVMNSVANFSLGSAMAAFGTPGRVSVNGTGIDTVTFKYKPNATTRRNNSVFYESPAVNGFKAMLFASLGEEESDGRPSAIRNNLYNAAVLYRAGKLSATAGVAMINDTTWGPNAAKSVEMGKTYFYDLAATYDFGVAKTSMIVTARDSSVGNASNPDLWAAELGAAVPVGAGSVVATVGYLKNESEKDADAWSWGVRYQHNLSKRTRAYVGVTGVENDDNAYFTLCGGGGSSKAPDVAGTVAGKSNNVVFAGIAHRF